MISIKSAKRRYFTSVYALHSTVRLKTSQVHLAAEQICSSAKVTPFIFVEAIK